MEISIRVALTDGSQRYKLPVRTQLVLFHASMQHLVASRLTMHTMRVKRGGGGISKMNIISVKQGGGTGRVIAYMREGDMTCTCISQANKRKIIEVLKWNDVYRMI